MKHIPKPQPGEYPPYASAYIDLLPNDGNVLEHMQSNLKAVEELVRFMPAERLVTPHKPGEWTINEILVHVMDVERIVAYRALRFARNDSTPLLGFEHNDYVPASGANRRRIDSVLDEYRAVRAATIALFDNLEDEALTHAGQANGQPLTVRAAAYFIAGHEQHHINSINENYV